MSPASRFVSFQICSPYFLQSYLSKTQNLSTPHHRPYEQFIHVVIDSKHANDLLDTMLSIDDTFFFPHQTTSWVGEVGINYMIKDIISHFFPPAYGINLKLLNIMHNSVSCYYLAPNSFHPCPLTLSSLSSLATRIIPHCPNMPTCFFLSSLCTWPLLFLGLLLPAG